MPILAGTHVGVDRERALETLLAFTHAPQHEQRDGVFEQIGRRTRIELQGPLVVRDCRDVITRVPIQSADPHEEIGVVGLTSFTDSNSFTSGRDR